MTEITHLFRYNSKRLNVCLFLIYIFIIGTSSQQYLEEDLNIAVEKFNQDLADIKNQELLVPVINRLYGSFKYVPKSYNATENVKTFKSILNRKLQVVFEALEKAKHSFLVTANSTNWEPKMSTILAYMRDAEFSGLPMLSNDTFLANDSTDVLNYVLFRLMLDLWKIRDSVKQVHILSSLNVVNTHMNIDYDGCKGVDCSLPWQQYVTAHNSYFSRRVILILDHGALTSKGQLFLTKQIGKLAISVLNPMEKFSVISISSKWSSVTIKEECENENLPSIFQATDNNKEITYNFIDSLNIDTGNTNHNLGIKIALKVARLFYSGNDPVMLLYVSGGQLFTLSEAIESLNIIIKSNLSCPIIINTCSVLTNGAPGMHFLPDFMNKYYSQQNVSHAAIKLFSRFLFVDDPNEVGITIARFYQPFSKGFNLNRQISRPMWDNVAQDNVISLSVGIPVKNDLYVFGVNLCFHMVVKEIMDYNVYPKYTYSLLMDLDGYVLLHPSIPLATVKRQMKFVHLHHYIKIPSIKLLEKNFLRKVEGVEITNFTTTVQYSWERISDHFVLCIVINKDAPIPMIPSKSNVYPHLFSGQILPYLLRLTVGSSWCKQLGHIVTLDTPSLYLSPICYENTMKIAASEIQKIFPDFKPFAIEKLQDGLDGEMAAIFQVMQQIQAKHLVNFDYIIRRYAATKSGILLVFPGLSLGHEFDPTKRQWFQQAQLLKGRLVFSPPYLDAGGAGYIITISYATPHVVLALDVTYGYIVKLLLLQMPDCLTDNTTCLLMDNRGYLVSHPDLIASIEREQEPIESMHIVHRESLVANDLLSRSDVVQKLACNDYIMGTVQRFYQFNLSYAGVLKRVIPGEHCVSYWLTQLEDTNLFLGVIKSSCGITPTFCPCSVVDRLCLNCQRMEKQECECPCECPVYRSTCTNYTSYEEHSLCHWLSDSYSPEPKFVGKATEKYADCFPESCNSKQTYMSCLGIVGCEWCKSDSAGYPLPKPFCSTMSACFNGVLGATSPYTDVLSTRIFPFTSPKSAGLILGTIIAAGAIFSLMFVCWKSYHSPRNQRVYLSARQEEQMHMSDLHLNEDFLELGNHSDKLLLDDKVSQPISPYCVTTNYARPATTADSDHGYSTMTPHDESEHLSLAPIEIDSLEEDMASDNTTPPVRHKVMPTTRLPHKNCIIVPVTVHRNVDAT